MKYSISVKQEDTSDTMELSPFKEDETVQNLSDTGWSCRHSLVTPNGKYIIMAEDVTAKSADDMYFSATLEPDHTAILDVGQYIWVIQIENTSTTPVFRKELAIAVGVDEHKIWSISQTPTIYDVIPPVANIDGDIIYDKDIIIDTAVLAAGVIKSIKLLDAEGFVIQTIGWASDTVVDTKVVITLTEAVKVTPTQLQVNI